MVSVSAAGPGVARIVLSTRPTSTAVDLTTNSDSTGHLLTFHNELFDATNSNVVGSDQGECIRIEFVVSWECRWVNILEGGSITVEGPFFDASASALAITGGTGAYRGAHGSMRLGAANEAATELDFLFRILG
jgi:allene oxide cyclase